jgi:hypothetical protein
VRIFGLKGRKWQEDGENCLMRSSINCMLHQTLLGSQIEEDEMGGTCSTHGSVEKHVQKFGQKTLRDKVTYKISA